jgi:hypothetical protein
MEMAMVCIGNGMVWYGMHCQLYALEMTMVCIAFPLYGMHWKWYGMVCIGNGIDNGNGRVCIDNSIPWKWYGMVWNTLEMTMEMVCISFPLPFHCLVWYSLEWYGMIW